MFSEEKNLQLAPGDEKELALFCSEVKRVDSGSQLLLEALFFSPPLVLPKRINHG